MAANTNSSEGIGQKRPPAFPSASGAKNTRRRRPQCQFCLRRNVVVDRDSSSPPPPPAPDGRRSPPSAARPAAAESLTSRPTELRTSDIICDECRGLRARGRIERALDRWDDLAPPPVLVRARPPEEARRKRRRASAVPLVDLPTMPPDGRASAGAAAAEWPFLRRRVAAAADGAVEVEAKDVEAKGVETTDVETKNGGMSVEVEMSARPIPETAVLRGGTKERGGGEGGLSWWSEGAINDGRGDDSAAPAPAPAAEPPNRGAGDLLGATVRIRKGKFAGLTGRIIERQKIQRVMLDSVPQRAFDVEDVTIVQPNNNSSNSNGNETKDPAEGTNEDLAVRYRGALVRVTGPAGGGRYRGMMGRVVRVVAGDWYITDNQEIANAFPAHKFEVLGRSADVDVSGKGNGCARRVKVGVRRIRNRVEVDRGRRGEVRGKGDEKRRSKEHEVEVAQEQKRVGVEVEEDIRRAGTADAGAVIVVDDSDDGAAEVVVCEAAKSKPSSYGDGDVKNVPTAASDAAETADSGAAADQPSSDGTKKAPADYAPPSGDGGRPDLLGAMVGVASVEKAAGGVDENAGKDGSDTGMGAAECLPLALPVSDDGKAVQLDGAFGKGDAKGCKNEIVEGSKNSPKEDDGTRNVSANHALHPKAPSPMDQNKCAGEGDGVRNKNSNNEEKSVAGGEYGGNNPCAESTSLDDQRKRTDKEEYVVVNGDSKEVTKQDVQEVVTEVYSVKLPSMENIELAARLSAFDSFLFLADDSGGGCTAGNSNEVANLAVNRSICSSRMTGDDNNDANSVVKERTTSAALATVASVAAKPAESEQRSPAPNPDIGSSTAASSSCSVKNNGSVVSKVILQLTQKKQKARQWPVVQVIPGTEVLVERKLKQPLRAIPLEERIVRIVPGGQEEWEVMAKKLDAFNDFLFLVDEKK